MALRKIGSEAGFIIRQYDSIHQFLKVAERGDPEGASHTCDGGWAGTVSHEQAVQFAKYGGWNPKIVRLRTVFDGLVPKLRKFVDFDAQRHHNVAGDEVDIARYLDGEPEHMMEWTPNEESVRRRALCLLIGHSVSGAVAAEHLFVRGQAVIALVRALSLLGYELEIWSEETCGGLTVAGVNRYSTLVRLHAAGEIMDESAVEFAIGNPSWLRRLYFASEEMESSQVRRQFGFMDGYGYGRPEKICHANLVGADLEIDLGRDWFGENLGTDPSRLARKGIEWVAGQLKELGVIDKDAQVDWDEG